MSIEKIIKCPNADTCNLQDYNFKGKPKKDNSKKGDIFQNCRSCGDYMRGDFEVILTAVIVKIAYNYEIIQIKKIIKYR